MASRRTGSLSLLQNYDSDSDKDSGYTSDQEKKRKNDKPSSNERQHKKRKINADDDYDDDHIMDCSMNYDPVQDEKLPSNSTSNRPENQMIIPLPNELQYKEPEYIDIPAEHGGRIRSTAHERGNWPSILYIPVNFNEFEPVIKSMILALTKTCNIHNIDLQPSEDHHISLSRTLSLSLLWIQPIVNQLRLKFSNISGFPIWLHGLKILLNEEKSRTFIGLGVYRGAADIGELIDVTDFCLREYGLPKFYQERLFHVSIGWCLGDQSKSLKNCLPQLESICQEYFNIEQEIRTFHTSSIIFKTGNRFHNISLKEER